MLISGHPWPDRKLYLTLSPCIAPVLLRILDSSSIPSSGCYPSRCASNCPRSALLRPIPTPECPRGLSYRVFIPRSWTVIRIQITYASTVPTRMSPSLFLYDRAGDRSAGTPSSSEIWNHLRLRSQDRLQGPEHYGDQGVGDAQVQRVTAGQRQKVCIAKGLIRNKC